ncbi:hypothetical protein F4782DRAFT_504677 [Xylaria castorea]|nr:hypothetical protein F4782DRAFT_504677 [Xylaria castorea]
MGHLQQQPGCRRCVHRGFQCPGLTKARGQTLILSNDSQLITNAESPLRLEQLKANPCLACLALGLSCTSTDPGETPCQNCLYAGSSDVLRSRLCMRATPFEDISIFLYCLPEAGVQRNDLDLSGILLDFDVTWTLPSIMSDVAELLRPASTKPTSKVGMFCSPSFVGLIQKHIPHKAASLFQSMLYGMSFSYVHSKHAMYIGGVLVSMLQFLGAQAGHQILRYLDNELNPRRLSTFSIEKRQVLFLLVFGAIMAVRYARRTGPMSKRLWEMMREHLCEVLAHHLVLLGASVGIPLSRDEEERVLRLPAITWNRKGTHAWEVDEKHSSCTSRVLKPRHPLVGARKKARYYLCSSRILKPHHRVHSTELPPHERPFLRINYGLDTDEEDEEDENEDDEYDDNWDYVEHELLFGGTLFHRSFGRGRAWRGW